MINQQKIGKTNQGEWADRSDYLLNPYSNITLRGGMRAEQREQNLQAFREGQVRFMICTDVAARGLDVKVIGQHTIHTHTCLPTDDSLVI